VSTPADPSGAGTPDPEVVSGMRRDMGRDLRRRREEAGLTQERFADLTGRYGRGTVSHAEIGTGDTGREFWVIADRLLGTGGLFAEFHDLIREYLGQEKRAAVTGDGVKELRSHVVLKSAQPLTALAGYRRLGWPVTADGDRLALVTGTAADVLEVTRPAGAVAAAWWLETGGAEDAARGLAALPAPGMSLAVIDAGERWYFLVSAGSFPWGTSEGGHAGTAPEGAAVRWHATGSSIPAPPSKAGLAAARWAHLPVSALQPAPALAVLDLLGKAAAMTCAPGTLRLPGGAVAVPAALRQR
jgi:transcriptional regulator with XRE-family HTH domain